MKIANQENWNKWVANNKDGYGLGIISYAERWADLMEERMAKGEVLADIAQETSHTADTEGITGFMYGAAVRVLATSWEHGDELNGWHNGKYGQPDAKGTVNPAILTVTEK